METAQANAFSLHAISCHAPVDNASQDPGAARYSPLHSGTTADDARRR